VVGKGSYICNQSRGEKKARHHIQMVFKKSFMHRKDGLIENYHKKKKKKKKKTKLGIYTITNG
jgi:hypothetical protein